MSRQRNLLYEFNGFTLDASGRVLMREGEVVPLAPKAIELLVALVENSGRVISKDELIRQVWPDSFVEEANLSHHIYALRKALGEDKNGCRYIETIPRRGYRFVAGVAELRDETIAFIEHTRAHVVIEEDAGNAQELARAAVHAVAPDTAAPPAAAGAFWPGRLQKGRMSLALSAAGLVLAAVLAATGWKLFSGSQAQGRQGDAAPMREMKITRVTNSGKVAGAIISPDGRFISYFENYTAGAGTLYVRQRETNNEIRLLEPSQRTFGGAAFSPDGAHIYYVVFDKRDPDGALYRVPVLGGPPTRLLGHFKSQFTLSPDGTQVAFYREEPGGTHESILVASLATGEARTLVTYPRNEIILSGSAAWSPDGAQIAFAAAPAREAESPEGSITLRAISLASMEVSQLSPERFVDVGKMQWMPDGQGLIFAGTRARASNQLYYLSYPERAVRCITNDLLNYGNYGLGITADGSALVVDIWDSSAQLWVVGADGEAGKARQLTLGRDDGARGIAPLDGGRIAYVARNGGQDDIWTIKESGDEARPLTADKFSESHLTATPDGRYLVFASDRAGLSHLFRVDADGLNLLQLTFGEASDSAPDCSPDGRWAVYTSTDGNKTTLWKVPIEGGTPVQLTDYESVAPAFSPDGQMISCILPAATQGGQTRIAIIRADGGPPLKEFQPLDFEWRYRPARWMADGQSLVFRKVVNQVSNLWCQPVGECCARPLTNFKSDVIFNYAFARTGRSIILSRGRNAVDTVLIENFRR